MIFALVGQKGGSGKTTTALSVAAELLARGSSVLVVDADPQLSARTWGEVATEAGHAVPTIVALGANMFQADQVPRLAQSYDHVVIDCPPSNGVIQRAALMSCDVALLPCGQSGLDAWALASTMTLVGEASALRPGLQVVALLTRVQGRTVLGQGARVALEQAGLSVLTSKLGYRVAFQEAITAGLGASTYAPGDAAAGEVRALVDELLALAPRPAGKAARAPRPPKPAAPSSKGSKGASRGR